MFLTNISLTVQQHGHVGVVLELVEAPLHHVLRVDLLNPQEIEHHVVSQVERRVDGVRSTLHKVPDKRLK